MNTKKNSNNYSQIRNEFRTSVRKSKLTTAQKCVAFILADYTNNETGLCCPSMTTLVDDASISKKTVSACIKVLERNGFIEVVRNKGKGNHYRIQPAREHQDIEKKERSYNIENLIQSYSAPEPDIYLEYDYDEFDTVEEASNLNEPVEGERDAVYVINKMIDPDVTKWTDEECFWVIKKWEYVGSEFLRKLREQALTQVGDF